MEIIQALPAFLLVLVRLTCFFLTAPVFSYRTIPAPFKIGLAGVFAYLITLTLDPAQFMINSHYALLVLKEATVGLTLGFMAGLLFYAVYTAGAFIDLQMGLSIANLIDPNSGVATPLTGQFLYIIMMVFLFTVDAHHMLLNGIFYSFQMLPLDQLSLRFDGGVVHEMVLVFVKMFAISFQMALPIVGSLFLVDLAVGIMSRAVPQLNVFVVGLPLKIGVGLVILFILMPLYVIIFREIFQSSTDLLHELMTLLGSSP
ncbi:flagellar biosynthetic protein FliR [Tuberibacillus calidus]|uniref:flagellar biosynthetic protein FliR n=1 Tax=Tuberibacillus calidus TaxID=340097 RepID=UPI000412559E|nr:flagellar biosynthetic protein FliR [Tuberibacillus calidus]